MGVRLQAQCGVKVKSGDRGRFAEALAHYNSHNFKNAAAELRKIRENRTVCFHSLPVRSVLFLQTAR